MSEELFEEQKYDINYWRSRDDEAQSQRKHIAEFIIFFDVVFILQRRSAEIMWECQIMFQCHWIRERYQYINVQRIDKTKLRDVKKDIKKVAEWAERHDFKFNERKHELIHFLRVFKRYNMNVNITLKEHRISASTDLKILRIQLNFKLRWELHFCQMKTKLMSRHNAINMIENLIWSTSFAISKQKYIIIEKSILIHEAAV